MIETVQAERQKQRKRTLAALLVSLLIHLLIILAAVVILSLKPQWAPKMTPTIEPPPVELTMIPPPAPPKKKERDFFDSSQGNVSEKAPDQAAFESDRNTTAASERPAQSDAPVPTQDGDNAPGLTLETKNLSLGPNKQPTAPSAASPAREEVKAAEKAREEKKPEKVTEETKEAKTKATPRPTPKLDDAELALLDPAKSPPAPKPPEPEVKKAQKPSPPSRPNPPSFQPQQRLTRLTGGIDSKKRGRASVNSVATPLGRYKKMLFDAIGSRWYFYVSDKSDLVRIGITQLRFVVKADGKLQSVTVLKNTSNETLASLSVQAIYDAEIPPLPKELAGVLRDGRLEVDFSFAVTP